MNVSLALVLLTAAGGVTLRWSLRRYDTLGRQRPFPAISVGLLACLAMAALAPWFLRIRLEHRLADAASKVVGTPVSVHCQSFGEAFTDMGSELGYVMAGPDGLPEKKTTIKRNQCRDLSDFLKSDMGAPTQKQVVAVHTLTHEAIHMSGVMDESQTECLAVQRDAEMAALLGASPQEAMNLARVYWIYVYPRMPADYTSSECGPGLALDIEGDSAPWDEVTTPVNDTL
jgi:hypothetical protein